MQNSHFSSEKIAEDSKEWLESLTYINQEFGPEGVKEIIQVLQNGALQSGILLENASLNTPYVNSIPLAEQPSYPGDIDLEKRIENIIRWNAMAMVLRAADKGIGVGGHIATYASAATMLEVGFNHVFKNKSTKYGGDMILPQPHAAPGIYARAFVEGRLSENDLLNFRQELAEGGGLCSYPHPRSMPEFWQMPNASMGLSTPGAIYQARFAKYLEHRGLKPINGGKVWCFIGDGESDEPEVLGSINIASREKLDNLVLVINCNLQRLDGPVRGNGKIIQELERSFRGADWQVLKVIWGSGWDSLLAQDHEGVLRRRMEQCVDGDYQRYSVLDGDQQREHWVEGNEQLEAMMSSLTDSELKEIKRGGQDHKKLYAAYAKAQATSGRPTVILVKTVKGDGMGASAQGKNTAHQKKDLGAQERINIGRNLGIPLSDEELTQADFYRPAPNSQEWQYIQQKRQSLGGFLPSRINHMPALSAMDESTLAEFNNGSGERAISTTTAMVRIIARLLKDKQVGKYIVPIVPDEARTFGMDGLFKQAGIYNPDGQKYTPVDADSLLPYREAQNGQILQEGICETGAMASFQAAGSAYSIHQIPTIPFYIFYSMFGFQRVGDMIWSCADMMCRGFLLGGTAGRTTLNGEGLQHQDGHSHLIANTFPNMRNYDPAFGYELSVIVQDGIKRMYIDDEKLIYYITVYNQNYPMPALPQAESKQWSIEEQIIKGAYCFKRGNKDGNNIHLLASGAIISEVLISAKFLESQGYNVNIWSITSFNMLEREANECERFNRLNVAAEPHKPYVQQLFAKESGVFVAVSDYMKALISPITKWINNDVQILGTDGFGVSESRESIRNHFETSPDYISQAALYSLYKDGQITAKQYQQQTELLNINPDKLNSMEAR